MIDIEHVTFTYAGSPQPSLVDCSLSIDRGEFVLLCGRSGSGKSTLTKLINGIIPTQTPGELAGHASIEGQDITDQPIWKTALSVGSVFQNPKTQFFNLDTSSELVFGLENAGVPREAIDTRLQTVTAEYGLEKLAGKSVFALSGGEKQKIAIASAYMDGPEVYVLDEPSANLDQEEIARLRELLAGLKRDGKTVLIAEHRVWYLADLIDRALYLEAGQIVQTWSGADFRALDPVERCARGLRSIQPVASTASITADAQGACSGLQVRGAKVRRNRHTLWDDLSFQAPRGKATAICGSNGAGKTTLAQCLCGLRRLGHGKIYLDGKAMTARALRRHSFLIMQDVNHQLFAESVLGEVKLGNGTSDEAAMAALEHMQLDGLESCHPMALSGGQKQRLAVVDGCLCQRDILIFDEPTSGLDLDNMQRVGDLIGTLLAQNKIVIVITHDLEFIQRLGASVI